MTDAPRLDRIKGGWAARGNGWAVHGKSKDDALARFWDAVKKHEEIDSRPLREPEPLNVV